MLAKLIEYDLQFILKTVAIYAVILLCCAALSNMTAYDIPCWLDDNYMPVCDEPPVFLQITHTIFWNAIFAVIIGLLLNSVIRTWMRFKINLFSDEGYLTNTLPITRKTLWASKFFSAIIVTLLVIGTIAIALSILQLTPSGKDLAITFGFGMPDATPIFYLVYLFTFFTQYLYATICGFTGITIGSKTNNHRNFRAVICGFAVYIIGILIMLGCFRVWANFDTSIHAMLFGAKPPQIAHEIFNQDFMIMALTGIGATYTALITTLYFINRKLLNDGINLD